MKYYNINGIKFGFLYQYDDYFLNNIEKYEIEECKVNHHIESIIVDNIELPLESYTNRHNNRLLYETETKERMIALKNESPVLMIDKQKDYSKVCLYIKRGMDGLSEIEYVYTGIIFMELCLYHSIQSLHGSAINVNNQAIIFSGPSGVGKSTHVNYWKQLKSYIEIINDDKPLISLNRTLYVSGSPWSGKTKMNQNITLPLHSIVFLEQGTENTIKQLTNQEKVIHIMRNINRPRQNQLWDNTQNILETLINDIPMYLASVTNNIEAAIAVREKIGV